MQEAIAAEQQTRKTQRDIDELRNDVLQPREKNLRRAEE